MERNQTIDAIKGILIVLVIFGHSLQYGFGPDFLKSGDYYDDYLFRIIYSFHMPLFMFISGYFFYFSNQKELKKVIYSKIIYIGLPFIVYYIILYFVWFYSYQIEIFYLSSFIGKIKSELWFLSSLLLNSLIVSLTTHFLKEPYCISILIILGILMLFIPDEILPSMHKYMYTFYVLAYYYKAKRIKLSGKIKRTYVMLPLTALFILGLSIYDSDIMIYEGGYSVVKNGVLFFEQLKTNVIRFCICMISSCWFIGIAYLILPRLHLASSFFSVLGKQTLAIYGIQTILFVLLSGIMQKYNINIGHYYTWSLILSFVIFTICKFLIYIINRNRLGRLLLLGTKS